MKIKRIVIENFKSIERIELVEPNPFTVFVGPNGSGKSNIFEALEFVNVLWHARDIALSLFGGPESLSRRSGSNLPFHFAIDFGDVQWEEELSFSPLENKSSNLFNWDDVKDPPDDHPTFRLFYNSFKRLFIKNERLEKFRLNDNRLLSLSAKNLEKVLKRILIDNTLKGEIFEWLELFAPGFKAVEIDDRNELHWFEKSTISYFTKALISDGTYNILALLTAVYQSDEPQFLCIEEPENGLHPQVQMALVEFFRKICQEKGHYIWLNTHSEAIVRKLTTDEIVLVDKQDGITRIQQVKGMNIYDIPTDEAWLTGTLGGGLPW